MDPISQGVVGATLSGSLSSKEYIRPAILIGFISALLADLDVLIRSSTDPILVLEYHRHFSHSLAFVPIGALLGTILSFIYWRRALSFGQRFKFAALGYMTAAPLDACTSYGTHLLWPFSEYRSAWHLISIVDPVFTLTILALVLSCYILRKSFLAKTALMFGLAYLCFGAYQRDQALAVSKKLASERGLEVLRYSTKPSLGNLFLWRSTLETKTEFWIDAIRVIPSKTSKIFEGGVISKVNPETDFPDLDSNSTLKKDIRRFAFFSDNYLAWHPSVPETLGDIRYAMLPNSLEPLWGITLDRKNPSSHVRMNHFRNSGSEKLKVLIDMIFND